MTHEERARWARRQSKGFIDGCSADLVGSGPEAAKLCPVCEAIERVAVLAIRAAVAESWEPMCEKTGTKAVKGVCPQHGGDACLVASYIVRAVAEEREACAQLVEGYDATRDDAGEITVQPYHGPSVYAAAIRARTMIRVP